MIKVSVKQELGIAKPIEIKQSNKIVRKTWVLQKAMSKMSIEQESADGKDLTPKEMESMVDAMLDFQDGIISYVVDVLRLTEKQAEAVEELSFNETSELAIKISSAVLGVETVPAGDEETNLKA